MRRLVVASLAVLAACGDPAVDGTYEGEPRLELDGLVCAVGNMDATTALGVAWTVLGDDGRAIDVVPGEAQPIDAGLLPAEFRVSLFELPPIDVATAIVGDDGVVANVAVGVPILFDDLDGDGAWQVAEPVLGASRGQVILYGGASEAGSDAALELEGIPNGYALGKARCADDALTGFALVSPTTRFDVWLFDGAVEHNPLEGHAPVTCLNPF